MKENKIKNIKIIKGKKMKTLIERKKDHPHPLVKLELPQKIDLLINSVSYIDCRSQPRAFVDAALLKAPRLKIASINAYWLQR